MLQEVNQERYSLIHWKIFVCTTGGFTSRSSGNDDIHETSLLCLHNIHIYVYSPQLHIIDVQFNFVQKNVVINV
jgi:hypothetical protein